MAWWKSLFQNILFSFPFPSIFFQKLFLEKIGKKNSDLEKKYGHEVLVILERKIPWLLFFQGMNSKQRAFQLFLHHRVWDTEENDGILFYILVAERKVEILADRAVHQKLGSAFFQKICQETCVSFQKKEHEEAIVKTLEAIFVETNKHFHPKRKENELSDRPLIL